MITNQLFFKYQKLNNFKDTKKENIFLTFYLFDFKVIFIFSLFLSNS